MKIHHFGLKVKDIDKSIKFYTEKLGFKIKTPKTTTEYEHNLYIWANLDLNGAELELIQSYDKNEKKEDINILSPPMCPHIGLESDDFDKDFELLKKRGVKIFDGPHTIPKDVKYLTVLDPDGYRVDIGQLLR